MRYRAQSSISSGAPACRALNVLLFAAICLLVPALAHAQSGRASLRGWVAFENVAYVDSQPRATVELRRPAPENTVVYSTQTDEHGVYHFDGIGLGEFVLHISAPRFQDYSAAVYIPSDFSGNWAVMLKVKHGTQATPRKPGQH